MEAQGVYVASSASPGTCGTPIQDTPRMILVRIIMKHSEILKRSLICGLMCGIFDAYSRNWCVSLPPRTRFTTSGVLCQCLVESRQIAIRVVWKKGDDIKKTREDLLIWFELLYNKTLANSKRFDTSKECQTRVEFCFGI